MKLNQETVTILKNFSAINPNIIIDKGNLIRTKTKESDLYAEYRSSEEFDGQIRLYDLNRFLSIYSITKNPSLNIQDKEILISGVNTETVIRQSAEALLDVAKKGIKQISGVVSLCLSEEDIKEIKQVAGVLQADSVAIESSDNSTHAIIKVYDSKKPDSDVYRKDVQLKNSQPNGFSFVFQIHQIAGLYPGSYDIEIAKETVAMFKHTSLALTYWLGQNSEASFFDDDA